MLESMLPLLEHAQENKYAVGAFNVVNELEIGSVFKAALDKKSPIIIQLSEKGCMEFGGGDLVLGAKVVADIVRDYASSKTYDHIPVALHLDHGGSLDAVIKCIESGFTSVMIDASKKSFDENVDTTTKVVIEAREYGQAINQYITVEAELGKVGGKATDKTHVVYTKLSEVVYFVQRTGIDALAIAWGTMHGANKSLGNPELRPGLIFDCVYELDRSGLDCHIVSHGSSTVPKYLVDQINEFGGDMPPTSGIPEEMVREAISNGVAKLNIATDLSLAYTGALRRHLVEKPEDWDPRTYAKSLRESVYRTVSENMKLLGSVGKIK